ncbi:MAG: ABC transporter ATP-binding protein [Clostridia bacterium]|nr:ABC transporter ATP-binding protein [Clostridia bacterium]
MSEKNASPVLETRHVWKDYHIAGENSLFAKTFHAVEDVSLTVKKGETFGIVGESGCGKSTMARLLMCLELPDDGEIYFQGQRIDRLPEHARRKLRPRFQMVFQDSGSSLNPRKRVQDILSEPMLYHKIGNGKQIDRRVEELLSMVGLPVEMKGRYPHEFSGGQRQRICIARALSLNPDVVVLDEPVSALDVSVQAQILNLLRELQERLGLTYVFIGHGLGAVHYISHRIAVMYMGRVVEVGTSDELFDHPAHPYTKALLDAAPAADADARFRPRTALKGEIDEHPIAGACPLYHRCPNAGKGCLSFSGEIEEIAPGHFTVCRKAWEE